MDWLHPVRDLAIDDRPPVLSFFHGRTRPSRREEEFLRCCFGRHDVLCGIVFDRARSPSSAEVMDDTKVIITDDDDAVAFHHGQQEEEGRNPNVLVVLFVVPFFFVVVF
jgi:hypothetical protein